MRKFTLAPTRQRQDELQVLTTGKLDKSKTAKHLFEGWQQRWQLRLVTIKYFMVGRQTFSSLHHAQHELALNKSGFGLAVSAHIVRLLCQSRRTNVDEVIKDQR